MARYLHSHLRASTRQQQHSYLLRLHSKIPLLSVVHLHRHRLAPNSASDGAVVIKLLAFTLQVFLKTSLVVCGRTGDPQLLR
jgi:hypothetical protein